jgi:hypothetical protein
MLVAQILRPQEQAPRQPSVAWSLKVIKKTTQKGD